MKLKEKEQTQSPKVKEEQIVPRREVWFLGWGMFGQSFIASFMKEFLFVFYTKIGIKAWATGLVLGVARIWDGFNDPIAGALVDRRQPSKNGKMRPLILYTSIPIGILTILLFFVPQNASIYFQCVWIMIFYLGWDVLYTIHDIGKWGLTARMSPLPNDRSKIITYGKILTEIGLVVPQIVMLLIDEGNMKAISEKTGWTLTVPGVLMASSVVFGVAGSLVMGLSYKAKERVQVQNERQSLIKDISIIFQNRTLMCLLVSTLLGSLVLTLGQDYYFFSTMNVGFKIFGKTIDGTNALAIYGALTAIPAALGMPFANMIGKRIGMKTILILESIVPAACRILAFLVGFEGKKFIVVLLLMCISTIPRGMHGIAYMSVITDSIDYVEWKTGRRTEGTTFAMRTLIEKIGAGVTTMMSGITLTLLKYNPTSGAVPGPIFTKWVWPVYMLAPALSALLAMIPLFFIDFVGSKKESILAELDERRKKLGEIEE